MLLIEEDGFEDVYDFTVPEVSNFFINDVLVHNCGESLLASFECCNLSEIFLNNVQSLSELCECSTLLYKTQKAVCAMNFLHEETNEIVHKNMRIGVGVTGICQSMDKLEWLDEAYLNLRKFDKQWSKENKWPESIRLSIIKPSGTVSLLAGATPGIHTSFAQFYIRRIRMASNDSLVSYCRNLGCNVEFVVNFDGSEDHNMVVISFPCKVAPNTILTKNFKAIEQLELVKKIQAIWADNAVSVTIYYKKEELSEIKEWLKENYNTSLKSVSFLLHSEHGFRQAPYEEITEERYNNMIKKMKIVDSKQQIEFSEKALDGLECAGGICPIK
jgi:hypothetical protein